MAKVSGGTRKTARKRQIGNLSTESLRNFFSGVYDEGSREFLLQKLSSRGTIERESDLELVNEIISKRKSWENATNSELIAIASLKEGKLNSYRSEKGLEENRKYNELSSKFHNARSKIKKDEYLKALKEQEPKTFAQLRKDKEASQHMYDKIDKFLKGYEARYHGSGWRDVVYRNYRKVGREKEIFDKR